MRHNIDIPQLDRELGYAMRQSIEHEAAATAPITETRPQPVTTDDRSKNPMRPTTWEEVIGQERAVSMMRRMVEASIRNGEPLDHVLLIGSAGTGKTTFANVIANERGVDCYQVAAPVSLDTLLELRDVMNDGDILFVDEIHMQAVQERRGKQASTEPEVFLQLLEDSVIATPSGMLPYPNVTVIGATTDEGMLPDPFIARFPLRPRLDKYSREDLGIMAIWNAQRLGLRIEIEAAHAFAKAARHTPREVNNYMKNAKSLVDASGIVTEAVAEEVLFDLNGVTEDGMTPDQQAMLKFLYTRGRRETRARRKDETPVVTYQASISTIATAIGKSRDSKAIQLRVEPYLIEQGWVQVGHGGRILTDAGIERARQLVGE